MTSDRSFGIVSALLLLCACGGGVHDLSVSAPPLLVIQGRTDLASLNRQNPDAGLVAALVWAGVPNIDPICLKYADDPVVDAGCPDPYGMFYGAVETSAPVGADGSFTLALNTLPAAAVSIGDTETRIAYGSLIIAEDDNGDGELSLLGVGGGGGGDGFGGGNKFAAGGPFDTIVAATFYSLHASQDRLAFREGGFVENSNFYPAPGCADPPQGFSFMSAPLYQASGGGTCSYEAASALVTVPALDAADAQALTCRPARQPVDLNRANDLNSGGDPNGPLGNLPPGSRASCLSHELLAVASTDPFGCPHLQGFALKGCAQDPFCTHPDWDDTANPPGWWPCP